MGVWAAAVAVTLLLGWQTTVGPVLVGFTARHGVHLGDLAVAANAATGAALVTYMLASPRRTPVASGRVRTATRSVGDLPGSDRIHRGS